MLLSDMKEGETGKISRIGGNGALRRRILEMGLLKNSEVYVEKYAPLKDPLELIVKGYHLSLRVTEASQITVEKIGSSSDELS
ncbi:MAG: ferrous iron transport protein A [Desulfobulbaceae bacterium]|nr:ferrous iron transport protein A [Desulfobulbaceae bacterium]